MTYYSLKRYEFTAYTLADLQKAGLYGSLSVGDCFKMPASSTTCISVVDNDSTLSGDRYCDDRSDDSSYQNADISRGSTSLGNGGQIYAEQVMKLWGTDGKVYWLVEIEQERSSAGDLFTFYGDVPPAGVTLKALCSYDVPSSGLDFRCLDGGPKVPVNTPPEITNAPKDCIEVAEGTQSVFDLDAKDLDGDTLTYAITGGADKARFVIDPGTGVISFVAPPDYESPSDAGGDNIYNITVTVSDGKGGTAVKALCVKVTDVVENVPGECLVIEAEDMWLCGYRAESNGAASGGQLVKLTSSVGYAVTTYPGETGTFDVKLYVVDENDGQGGFKVYVGNTLVKTVWLNQNNGGDGQTNTTLREVLIEDVNLQSGQMIKIVGYGNCNEYARIDRIEICGDEPKLAALGDYVWFDADKDGVQDDGEEGVAGVTVNLLDAGGNVIATQATDSDGGYFFDDLVPGTYSVEFVLPGDGRVFTQSNVGDDALDSDASVVTGRTQQVTLAAGETNRTLDAGLIDPGTAALGDRIWYDTNRNGVQDGGEVGAAGVGVALLNAAGAILATTTTDSNGNYLFDGLDAGDYRVDFDEVDGFDFTTQDSGPDDADSDADPTTGRSQLLSLAIGETNLTLDAGLVRENTDPTPDDDAGKVCATEAVSIDVLDGDTDPESDPLTIVAVDGQAISVGGTVVLTSGATVTLNGDGTLSYDSSGGTYAGIAAADLTIGSEAADLFTYTVDDGQGGIANANVDVTICGAKNTLETIDASLPSELTHIVARVTTRNFDDAYTVTVSLSGDPRLDGVVFTEAYCINTAFDTSFETPIRAEIFVADAALYTGDDLTQQAIDNLDLINWILNQGFGAQDNGDGTGETYTDWEIQAAIWELTNGEPLAAGSRPAWGTLDNALEIAALAQANGEGFTPGEGDIVGLILDPLDDQPEGVLQPFIIGVHWETLEQDCLC